LTAMIQQEERLKKALFVQNLLDYENSLMNSKTLFVSKHKISNFNFWFSFRSIKYL